MPNVTGGEVRPAQPGGCAAVRELLARRVGVAPEPDSYTAQNHAHNLATFGDGFIVATGDGAIVGHAGVRWGSRANEANLVEFYGLYPRPC